MKPSGKERRKIVSQFHLCYVDLCKMWNVMPLTAVLGHQKQNMLRLSGDRLTYEEWTPVLYALRMDKSLRSISVHSRRAAHIAMEDVATESRVRAHRRVPLLQTRHVLLLLLKAIRTCMCQTEVLTSVELEGLPLSPNYLREVIEGMHSCTSLQHISLCHSAIGDEGCQMICHAVKLLTNIQSVDLSSCGITADGVLAVTEMLKYRQIQLPSDSWQQTLRGQQPDLDSLPAVRRVTLNDNVNIGDMGAVPLMDVLRDDIFLKALDLQNCGIGNTGGKLALEMLLSNKSMEVLDLHGNQNISSKLLAQIMRQLHLNNKGVQPKYHRFQLGHKPLRPRLHVMPRVKKTSYSWKSKATVAPNREHAEGRPGVWCRERCHTLPSCCSELEKTKQQLLWMSQQLSNEAVKYRQVEEKNLSLQQHLDRLLGHDCVLVERQTMAAIQESFSAFQKFIRKLQNVGLSDLLNAHVLDSLENPATDCHQHLSSLIRTLRSNKSNHTDMQGVFTPLSQLQDGVGSQQLMGVTNAASARDLMKLIKEDATKEQTTRAALADA